MNLSSHNYSIDIKASGQEFLYLYRIIYYLINHVEVNNKISQQTTFALLYEAVYNTSEATMCPVIYNSFNYCEKHFFAFIKNSRNGLLTVKIISKCY